MSVCKLIIGLSQNTIHDPLEAVTLMDFFAIVVMSIYLERNCKFLLCYQAISLTNLTNIWHV